MIVAILIGVVTVYSGTVDSIKSVNDKLKFTPHIKTEFIGVQQLDTNMSIGSLIFGDNNFGITATKGDLEAVASVSLIDVPTFGVGIDKMYISKGLSDAFNLTVGYKDLPYGLWFSNCVNYPLVRSGDFNTEYSAYVIKTKAPQIGLTWEKGFLTTDVVGYMNNGKFKSVVAKSEFNLGDVISINASVKCPNLDTLSMACGGVANLGKFQLSGLYSHNFSNELSGAYAEFSVFPTDNNVTAVRGDVLINKYSQIGMTSYSLSSMFSITENFYVGTEYTLKSNVIKSKMQTPTHWITGIIGVEF